MNITAKAHRALSIAAVSCLISAGGVLSAPASSHATTLTTAPVMTTSTSTSLLTTTPITAPVIHTDPYGKG